jgi:dephospho-CoA kinase
LSNNLKIGVTGGIGSGKTVICRIFQSLGVPTYDADSRARYILNNNPALKSQILELFGKNAYTSTGLNNVWIAQHVFNDEDKLHQLNSLVHPLVGKDFEEWSNRNSDNPYVIKEAALLYESGSYQDLDKVVVVVAPESLRIKRVLLRDKHRTEDQVKAILKRQWSEEDKIAKADFLIRNNDKELVIPQVLELHENLLELSSA